MKKIINRIKYNFYYAYYGIQNYISKQIFKMYAYEQFHREAYTWEIYKDVMRNFSVDGLPFLQKTKYFFLSLINIIDRHTSLKEWSECSLEQSEDETEDQFLARKRNAVLRNLNAMSFLQKFDMYYGISDYISKQIVKMYMYEQFTKASTSWADYKRVMSDFSVDKLSLQKTVYFFLSLINRMNIDLLEKMKQRPVWGSLAYETEDQFLERKRKTVLEEFNDMSFFQKVDMYYGISDYIQNQIDLVHKHKTNIEPSSYDEAQKRNREFYYSERDNMPFFEKAKYFFLSLINSMDIKILRSLVDEIYGKNMVVDRCKSFEAQRNEALALFEEMSFLDKVSKYLTSFLSEEMVDICLDHGANNNFTADQVKHLAHFIDIDFSKLLKDPNFHERDPVVREITYNLANFNILLELQKNREELEKNTFFVSELKFSFDPRALIKLMTLVGSYTFRNMLSKCELLSETDQNQKNILEWLHNSSELIGSTNLYSGYTDFSPDELDYSTILRDSRTQDGLLSTDKLQSKIDFLSSLNEVLSDDKQNASHEEVLSNDTENASDEERRIKIEEKMRIEYIGKIKSVILQAIEYLTQELQDLEQEHPVQELPIAQLGNGQGPSLNFSGARGNGLSSASSSPRM